MDQDIRKPTAINLQKPIESKKPSRPTGIEKNISKSAPLNLQRPADSEKAGDTDEMDEKNQGRREDRIKRDNLLRYYDSEYKHAKGELNTLNKDLKELSNKVREGEREVKELEQEEASLKTKLKMLQKNLRRFSFELRVNKGDQMEKRVAQRRWASEEKRLAKKLKKIKFGDWRAIKK